MNEYTPEEFTAALNELFLQYGYIIQPKLNFKQQIDGTFTLAVELVVVPTKH